MTEPASTTSPPSAASTTSSPSTTPPHTPQNRLHRVLDHLNPSSSPAPPRSFHRACLIAGCRTPFIKSFTSFRSVPTLALSAAAVSSLLSSTSLPPPALDLLILGNVVVSTSSPNVARETVLDLHLPPTLPAFTVSAACVSGLEAIAQAVAQVETGHARCVIAGGVDSCSSAEMPLPQHVTAALAQYQMGGGNKAGWRGQWALVSGLGWPWRWLPSQPTVSERSTGKTMGFHSDMMAEINGVTRKAQDEYTVESHRKASAARKEGRMAGEVCAVTTPDGAVVDRDNLIRDSIDVGRLASLPPVFRPPPLGTVTAASSSALTDGAAVVLVMEEGRAREMGYAVDISVRAYVRAAFEPFPQLLLAPALAIPRALREAGLKAEDVDLWELHEAFAGQVLATLKVLEDEEWYERVTGRRERTVVDRAKLNVNGGSVALGHPFAATGGRLVTSACNELRRRKARFCLISICAAGGLGGVMILERRSPDEP